MKPFDLSQHLYRSVFNLKDFGALGNGLADDSVPFRAALSKLQAEGGGALLLPPGTYIVTPDQDADNYIGDPAFGLTLKYALPMYSNVKIIGQNATIKVANGISTRAAPQNFSVFYSEETLHDLEFQGLTFDLNSANNYFSPDPLNTGIALEARYFRYHQAAIFFEAANGKADDVDILNCTFKNGNGVSTIIMGRVAGSGLGRRWRIIGCNFLELGLDTYDHSSIFAWANNVLISKCFWRNNLIYAPTAQNRTGINAPIETHGSDTLVVDNVFENCNRGTFITENTVSRVERVTFARNIIREAKYAGLDIAFDGSGAVGGPRDIFVVNNQFGMSSDDTNVDGATTAGSVHPCAVAMLGLDGAVAGLDGVTISNNKARRAASASGRACKFFALSLQNTGFNNIVIKDNEAIGFTQGGYIVTGSTTAAGTVRTIDNRWMDPEGGSLGGVNKLGVMILAQGGTIGRFEFGDSVEDGRATNSQAFGLLVSETSPTTVREFIVNKRASFDARMTETQRLYGVTDLTVTRLIGVPVETFWPDVSYGAGAGSQIAVTIPGAKPSDEFLLTFPVAVTNAGGFLWTAYYSGANQVSFALRNVSSGTLFTTPGFYFRITAYPGK